MLSSEGPRMVNGLTLPQNAMEYNDSCIVIFGAKAKVALGELGNPLPKASSNTYNDVLFTAADLFPCKKCFPTI